MLTKPATNASGQQSAGDDGQEPHPDVQRCPYDQDDPCRDQPGEPGNRDHEAVMCAVHAPKGPLDANGWRGFRATGVPAVLSAGVEPVSGDHAAPQVRLSLRASTTPGSRAPRGCPRATTEGFGFGAALSVRESRRLRRSHGRTRPSVRHRYSTRIVPLASVNVSFFSGSQSPMPNWCDTIRAPGRSTLVRIGLSFRFDEVSR